jgi:flagellar P-ring protein FlgI
MRILLALFILLTGVHQASAVRVKDLARIQGSRQNQLIGYGVVVGLAGTGDSNPNLTLQTVANYMMRFGLTLATTDIKANNLAIVIVTTDLPAFVRTGTRIDVNVASMADSKSLQGGVLMQTPLIGADGQIYAVAQGPVVVGGSVAGSGGATSQKNHPTTAQISGGALVEREIPSTLVSQTHTLDVSLRDPDFTTAARMADAFGLRFAETAIAVDAGTVRVNVPLDYQGASQQIQFISQLENVELEPDTVTKVVINERTGTIVANSRVRISSVAVTHGNITVSITTNPIISQPNAFSNTGTTVATTTTTTAVKTQNTPLYVLQDLPTVDKVAAALNALGASPRDVMTIFQTIKQAGALQAELVVR